MITDPIANMLTSIRNASLVGKDTLFVPSSKVKTEILKVLEKEGWVAGFEIVDQEVNRQIKVDLFPSKRFSAIERVSKPGRRIYASYKKIPRVTQGEGFFVISTSKGLMTDKEAKKQGLGGEILCKIY